MVLAQLGFGGMNVFSRLGGRDLPFSEVAAARFLVGALVAIGLARLRGTSLRVTDGRNTWLRSLFGTGSAIGHLIQPPGSVPQQRARWSAVSRAVSAGSCSQPLSMPFR